MIFHLFCFVHFLLSEWSDQCFLKAENWDWYGTVIPELLVCDCRQFLLTFLSWGSLITLGRCMSLGVFPLGCCCLGLLLNGKAFWSSLGMWRGLKCLWVRTTDWRENDKIFMCQVQTVETEFTVNQPALCKHDIRAATNDCIWLIYTFFQFMFCLKNHRLKKCEQSKVTFLDALVWEAGGFV